MMRRQLVEVRGFIMFSQQSLIPACAGTPRYGTRGSGWRVFSTVAREEGWLPDFLVRGTSPSPRGIFDRGTFTPPRPSWIPAFAGMTIARIGGFRSHGPRREKSLS